MNIYNSIGMAETCMRKVYYLKKRRVLGGLEVVGRGRLELPTTRL